MDNSQPSNGLSSSTHRSRRTAVRRSEGPATGTFSISKSRNIACQSSSTPVQSLTTAFSLTHLHGIISNFNLQKKEIVKEIGFGSLLNLVPMNKFPRKLSFWLLNNINPNTRHIELPQGQKLSFSDADVDIAIGLPAGKSMVRISQIVTVGQVTKIRKLLMLDNGSDITLDSIQDILSRDYAGVMSTKQCVAFQIAFLLYADAYFIAPKGQKARINQGLFMTLSKADLIQDCNWCGYLIRCLIQSSKRVHDSLACGYRTILLDGCLLFIVVLYLDNLNFGSFMVSGKIIPRFQNYTPDIISMLEKSDKRESSHGPAIYGRHQLIPDEQAIYSRNNLTKRSKSTTLQEEAHANSPRQIDYKIIEATKKLNQWAKQVTKTTNHVHSDILSLLSPTSILNDDQSKGSVVPNHTPEVVESSILETPTISDHTQKFGGSRLKFSLNQMKTVNLESFSSVGRSMSQGKSLSLTVPSIGCHYSEERSIVNFPSETDNRTIFSYVDSINNSDSESECDLITHPKTVEGSDSASVIYSENMIDAELQNELKKKLAEMGFDFEVDGNVDVLSDHVVSGTTDIVLRDTNTNGNVYEACLPNLNPNQSGLIINHMHNIKKFGVSPFALGFIHQDAPIELQHTINIVLPRVMLEETNRTWFLHMVPNKIQIDGKTIQLIFHGKFDFVPSAIDALLRLYQQMDDEMYSNLDDKRWRHFLTSEFALWALSENPGSPTQTIRNIFIGPHISYNTADCRLVFAPLMVHWEWCFYVWDFLRRKLVVLDPNSFQSEKSDLLTKHKNFLTPMHNGMKLCFNTFFPNDTNSFEDWDTEFIYNSNIEIHSSSSGVCSMFCARHFDGQILTRILTKEATQMQRCNLLYQLLTMKGNFGNPPHSIVNPLEVV